MYGIAEMPSSTSSHNHVPSTSIGASTSLSVVRPSLLSSSHRSTLSSYLDVFLPSKNFSPYRVIPKCVCNMIFLLLLISKGNNLENEEETIDSLHWILVFIPLFVSNIIVGIQCWYEIREYLHYQQHNSSTQSSHEDHEEGDHHEATMQQESRSSSRSRSRSNSGGSLGSGSNHDRESSSSIRVEMTASGEIQEIGTHRRSYDENELLIESSPRVSVLSPLIELIDQMGSFYAKCIIIHYLITESTGTITESMIPYWLCMTASISLRSVKVRQLYQKEQELQLPTHLLRDALIIVLFFTIRGLQLFLITLHLDLYISSSWILVLMPMWICIFGAFASALLLLAYTPMMYSNLTYATPLKLHCHRFSFGLAIYFAVYAMTGFATLLFLSERLAFEYDQPGFSESSDNGVNHSITKIIIPLIILVFFIAVLNPFLFHAAVQYKVSNYILFDDGAKMDFHVCN